MLKKPTSYNHNFIQSPITATIVYQDISESENISFMLSLEVLIGFCK